MTLNLNGLFIGFSPSQIQAIKLFIIMSQIFLIGGIFSTIGTTPILVIKHFGKEAIHFQKFQSKIKILKQL